MNQFIKSFEEFKEIYMSPQFEEVLRQASTRKVGTRHAIIINLIIATISLALLIIMPPLGFIALGIYIFVFVHVQNKVFKSYTSYYENNFKKLIGKATGVKILLHSKKNINKKQFQDAHIVEKANKIATRTIGTFNHEEKGITTNFYEVWAYKNTKHTKYKRDKYNNLRKIQYNHNKLIDQGTIMSMRGLNNVSAKDFRIFIKNNDNIVSNLTESTIDNMMKQKENEIKFNRIDLNKYFDCFVFGTKTSEKNFNIEALEVITPAVENLLAYIRKKFGKYNISINDNRIDIEFLDMKKNDKWRIIPYLYGYRDLKISYFYRLYELIESQKLIIKFLGGGSETEFISEEDVIALEEAISSNKLTDKEMDRQVEDYFERVVIKRRN